MRGLILAAGLGERLRPITDTRAKPAVEFLNMPMLTFPYHWLNTLKLRDLVFNTHYLPDSIRHAAMHVVDPTISLHFTHEPAILGSGGGIAGARMYLQGERTFAVANGDGVVLCEDDDVMERMLEFHESRNALATLLVCPLEGVGTRLPGVWMDPYGEVFCFGKEPTRSYLECFHYASFMLLNRRIWSYLPDGNSNILYDVLQPRMDEGEKVYGFRVDNIRWFETGNAPEYLQATQTCLELLCTPGSRLGACVRRILEQHGPPSGARSQERLGVLIADSAEVAPGADLRGFAVIGERAVVADDARLENCVVLSEAQVRGAHKNEVIISGR
jgi:NDP-sugar pyrophosphorylase family protein